MESSDVSRAIDAAISIAVTLDLPADDAIILHNSNKLALRLLPCDVFARVAPVGTELARFEVELAQRLTAADSPVAALYPRVEPRAYECDGFEANLWTYYELVAPRVLAADYGTALHRLHTGMRTIDVPTPHFTERVADPTANIAKTPALDADDRELLTSTLRDLRRAITSRGAPEQLVHGEPHPGNVLSTQFGPLFIDLETCCRGPVEFDLAHAPAAVSEHYSGLDHPLLSDCRGLVLAVAAKHRCAPGDQLPNGQQAVTAIFVTPSSKAGRASVPEYGNNDGAQVERIAFHPTQSVDELSQNAQFAASSCVAVTNAASVPHPGETSSHVSIERSMVPSAAVG